MHRPEQDSSDYHHRLVQDSNDYHHRLKQDSSYYHHRHLQDSSDYHHRLVQDSNDYHHRLVQDSNDYHYRHVGLHGGNDVVPRSNAPAVTCLSVDYVKDTGRSPPHPLRPPPFVVTSSLG